jgi:hypothetical protein
LAACFPNFHEIAMSLWSVEATASRAGAERISSRLAALSFPSSAERASKVVRARANAVPASIRDKHRQELSQKMAGHRRRLRNQS